MPLLDSVTAGDLLRTAVPATFNRITVDRDTSTNDTVLLLASGAAGAPNLAADDTEEAAVLPLRSKRCCKSWRS